MHRGCKTLLRTKISSLSVGHHCLSNYNHFPFFLGLKMFNGVASFSNGTDKSPIETAKQKAAIQCVDENVESDQVIGIGTGTTSFYAIEHLGHKFKSGQIVNIFCVPTSIDSRHLIIKNALPLSDLERHPFVDVYIDGADEVDQKLDCIKGAGGCLAEEKIVMGCSKRFFLVADYRKKSEELGEKWKSIPIEVCRSAHVPVSKRIEKTEGGLCKLRTGSGKAGPLLTDNGNFIVDWYFPSTIIPVPNWNVLNVRLKMIPGVVETGLFLETAEKAYFGMENGTVLVMDRKNKISNGDTHY